MHILLFILLFIIAIVVFGLSIVGFLLKSIFGLGRGSSSSSQNRRQSDSEQPNRQNYNQRPPNSNDDEEEIYSENVSGRRHKKIFTKDEGEYVDFEEIKE